MFRRIYASKDGVYLYEQATTINGEPVLVYPLKEARWNLPSFSYMLEESLKDIREGLEKTLQEKRSHEHD